ncbi:SBF-like CPA transporter family-domain-containing protein [Chlamydoabsidia padenii]|nr:SBF-like CPA transporter family-domain-containing protein [Chlamydoabsidia padenii]
MVISPAGSISSTLKSDHASSFHEEIQDPQKPQQQQQPTAPAPLTRWAKIRKISWELFVKYWFLIGLGFVIGLAFAIPWVGKSYGSIQAQYTVKWGAVIVIFFLSGLGLDVMVMLKTILRWRLHLYVQFVSFIILPFLAWGIVRFFIAVGANLDNMVYQGWIIALSTSTTVSSNSVMTRNANGNDSAAVFNAALGNVLGIFISPALMTVFGDDRIMFPPGSARGTPDYTKILFQLGLSVLVPLVVGQVIRFFFPAPIKKLSQKLKFPIINSVALLIMVWSVFCDGVASDAFHRLSGADIVAIIGVDIFLYIFGCALCLFICRLPWWGLDRFGWEEPAWLDKYRMSRKDAAAVMYCGATKTVSMGIPLISVLYADTSYGVVGVLSLPLLLYHICQLFIGNFQVSWLKKWIENGEEQDRQKASIQQEKIDAPETESLPSFNTRRRTNGERTSSE